MVQPQNEHLHQVVGDSHDFFVGNSGKPEACADLDAPLEPSSVPRNLRGSLGVSHGRTLEAPAEQMRHHRIAAEGAGCLSPLEAERLGDRCCFPGGQGYPVEGYQVDVGGDGAQALPVVNKPC